MLKEETTQYKIENIGTNAITDAEVIAGIICNGDTPQAMKKAMEIARKILSELPTLAVISRLSVSDLESFMTKSQAFRLTSAFEFAKRKAMSPLYDRPRISSSRDAFNVISTQLDGLYHEEFWLLLLNKANEVIAKKQISIGGTAGTVADVKIIFKKALAENGCAAIIAFYNHPSGNLKPSDADIQLTKKMKEAGKIMDMPVLDHIIVSERGYYSFADEGTL